MTEPQTSLLTSTALNSALFATMTPAERAAGRFMRAPDHGDGGPPADPAPADPPADPDPDPADPPADDHSLMNPAPADPVDPPADPADPEPAAAAPEKYDLTPPEGMEINAELLAEVDPIFRELGLTNEQANTLMPLADSFAKRLFAAQNDAFQAQATDWAKQAKADPVLGGKNWAGTEQHIAKLFDVAAEKLPPTTVKGEDGKSVTLTGAEQIAQFKALLDQTMLGNNPTLMRVFRFVGEQFGEAGDLARSDAGAPVKSDRLAALYPNDVPKEAVQ